MPASRRHGRVPIPRRLRRDRRDDAPAGAGAVASGPIDAHVDPAVSTRVDVQVALSRAEVDALVREMHGPTGWPPVSPATPDRVRAAVEVSLGPDLAGGSVLVTRLPRALHSSETWHVRLVGVTPAGRDRLAQTVRTARMVASALPSPGSSTAVREDGDVR